MMDLDRVLLCGTDQRGRCATDSILRMDVGHQPDGYVANCRWLHGVGTVVTHVDYSGRSQSIAGVLGTVAWVAVFLSLGGSLASSATTITDGVRVLVAFSGYLTIWTNAAIAIALTVPLLRPEGRTGRFLRRPGVLTALAAAITIVALGYELLLRQSWGSPGIDLLANLLVHYLIPLAYVGYWWTVVPSASLSWRAPIYWSSYMIAYSVYVIVRGEVTGQYPYPFVDVAELGYATTLRNALGFLLLFVLVSLGYVAVNRAKARL